jgi:hypothetical protein
MNSFLQKSSFSLLFILIGFLFFQTSCVVSDYGRKTKDAIVRGSSYVGEKSKSAYRATKEKLGITDSKPVKPKPMSVAKSKFGEMPDGAVVSKYTLSNANGMRGRHS